MGCRRGNWLGDVGGGLRKPGFWQKPAFWGAIEVGWQLIFEDREI